MGFCSIGLLWRLAGEVLHVSRWIGEPVLGLGIALFIVLLVAYSAKTVRRVTAVWAELNSSATSSHFGCISISLVLISAAVFPYSNTVAIVIWSIGAFAQMIICVYVIGHWIRNDTLLAHASPAWLIPIVGNATAAFTGAPLGFHELAWALFSIGVVSWLAFLPILLNGLIFHPELPNNAMPSLAIFVSAPAVAALGWRVLVTDGDIGFRFFLFTALFFALLILRLSASLARADFSVAWWAYTFPSGALANGLLRYSESIRTPWTTALAWLGLVGASAVLLLVAAGQMKAIVSARAGAPLARLS
jgi:tellurite resistance protein